MSAPPAAVAAGRDHTREEAKRGKVAILFGNERTGLTNDELAQAHAAVAIPTAGQGALCRKSLKYTGGTGPTSLNLSQAVGVLAYELFMVRGDGGGLEARRWQDRLITPCFSHFLNKCACMYICMTAW